MRDKKIGPNTLSTAKVEVLDGDMLSHPLDELLKLPDDAFTEDDERLLKIMSLAIQNGAPPNLVSLYLKGHVQKSHILNFIRTSVKSRKRLEIDISNVDYTQGHLASDPIDLISPMSITSDPNALIIPMSMERENNNENKIESQAMINSASTCTALQDDPPSQLRKKCTKDRTDQGNTNQDEFKPTSANNDGHMSLQSFKDYQE